MESQTISVKGIFPLPLIESIKNKGAQIKEYFQNKKFEAIRNGIVANTLNMTTETIEFLKGQADHIEEMDEAARISYLYGNAMAAKKANRKTPLNITLQTIGIVLAIAGLIVALPAISTFSLPALIGFITTATGTGITVLSNLLGIRGNVKGKRGLVSDQMLKQSDFKDGFEPFYEKYQFLLNKLASDKDMLLSVQKSMKKKDFEAYIANEYMPSILNAIEEFEIERKRAEELAEEQKRLEEFKRLEELKKQEEQKQQTEVKVEESQNLEDKETEKE